MQLSVYFGQRTILSSWPQEVQTGWHGTDSEAYLFHHPLHSLHCYDYIMRFPSLLSFIFTNAHRTCIMSSSVHPTSCYNFVIVTQLGLFSLPLRINTSIPADSLRNHFRPADTSSHSSFYVSFSFTSIPCSFYKH